jgi:hypothetical protein
MYEKKRSNEQKNLYGNGEACESIHSTSAKRSHVKPLFHNSTTNVELQYFLFHCSR